MCLDSPAKRNDMHKPVGLYPCHNQGGNQVNEYDFLFFFVLHIEMIYFDFKFWLFSKTGEIRRDESCVDYAGSDVILYPCHGSKGNQYWAYDHKVSMQNPPIAIQI